MLHGVFGAQCVRSFKAIGRERDLFKEPKEEAYERWKRIGVNPKFLSAWAVTYLGSNWGIACAPPGVPSTDNPLEGLFRAVKDTYTGRRELPVLEFLDLAAGRMLFDWSMDLTTACTGVYPNNEQRTALRTAQASKYYQHGEQWVSCRRRDGLAKAVTAEEGSRVISVVAQEYCPPRVFGWNVDGPTPTQSVLPLRDGCHPRRAVPCIGLMILLPSRLGCTCEVGVYHEECDGCCYVRLPSSCTSWR